MLTPTDERLLRAIVALKTRPEGQLFFEWLAQCEEMNRDRTTFLDNDVVLRRAQGASQLLRDLNKIIASAETLANPSR
jgi:hypothetical protein